VPAFLIDENISRRLQLTTAKEFLIRHVEPSDYQPVISVINDWWGGRNMSDMLPKLFFIHFRETSFTAKSNGKIIGFLIGFLSQTFQDEAYIHFAGVHPHYRKMGLGHALYERFFEAARNLGRTVVRCVTSPVNKGSIAFHLRMGFGIERSETIVEGISFAKNYDGHGGDRVLFSKTLNRR
jgi:ribosomal protein S18 acetylase RimI-like enzyme